MAVPANKSGEQQKRWKYQELGTKNDALVLYKLVTIDIDQYLNTLASLFVSDVEEVLSFSPMFREKIRKTEIDIEELSTQLKKTSKQAKDVIKLSKGNYLQDSFIQILFATFNRIDSSYFCVSQ